MAEQLTAEQQAFLDDNPYVGVVTTLREAFDSNGEGDGLELYFGATSGDVFGSADAGGTWTSVAEHLPPVYSVRAA